MTEPRISVLTMDRLPDSLLEELREWYAQGKPLSGALKRIEEAGYSIAKSRVEAWLKALPLKKLGSIDDLPPGLKDKVFALYRERKPKAEIIDLLARRGYRVDQLVFYRLARSLLSEAQAAENRGELEFAKDLEGQALTQLLDWFLKFFEQESALKRPELRTPNDWKNIAEVLLRLVNTSVQRRRLELEEEVAVKRAKDELKSEFQRLLAGRPDLVTVLAEIADQAGDKLLSQK